MTVVELENELAELRALYLLLRDERDAALDREAGLADALDAMRRQSEEQAEEARKWRARAEAR